MRFLIYACFLLACMANAQATYPIGLQWDYPSNALFQLDWQAGSLLTTARTAIVSVPAGTNIFSVRASIDGTQSQPSNMLTVLVMRAELQVSSNLLEWNSKDTNHFMITNFTGGAFYRVKLFWPL